MIISSWPLLLRSDTAHTHICGRFHSTTLRVLLGMGSWSPYSIGGYAFAFPRNFNTILKNGKVSVDDIDAYRPHKIPNCPFFADKRKCEKHWMKTFAPRYRLRAIDVQYWMRQLQSFLFLRLAHLRCIRWKCAFPSGKDEGRRKRTVRVSKPRRRNGKENDCYTWLDYRIESREIRLRSIHAFRFCFEWCRTMKERGLPHQSLDVIGFCRQIMMNF